MKKSKKCTMLFILLSCSSLVFSLGPSDTASIKIPYDGLTGTIENLLKSRETTKVVIGSYGYCIEDFIDDDINELYSCDSLLNEYLENNDNCNYERLSEIIRENIVNHIDDKSATLYVFSDASEEGNNVYISIGLNFNKKILLPFYLETDNGEVKVSLTIPCTIECNVLMNLDVDSDKVINDSALRGTSISIDQFEISIQLCEDEWDRKGCVLYEDNLYVLSVLEHTVNIDLYWFLCDKEGNYLEDEKTTYEQLSNGDYKWILNSISEVAILGEISTELEDDENNLKINYVSSDLIIQQQGFINIVDDEGSRDLNIKKLTF